MNYFAIENICELAHYEPDDRSQHCLTLDLTNGTLLNEEWCQFLKQNRFLVGFSIDGPEELHDAYRVAKDGKPTFKKVFAASQLLHKYGIRFNNLSVINRTNALRPLEEANAIGTACLRTQLLPDTPGKDILNVLRSYVDIRVKYGLAAHSSSELATFRREGVRLQKDFWG